MVIYNWRHICWSFWNPPMLFCCGINYVFHYRAWWHQEWPFNRKFNKKNRLSRAGVRNSNLMACQRKTSEHPIVRNWCVLTKSEKYQRNILNAQKSNSFAGHIWPAVRMLCMSSLELATFCKFDTLITRLISLAWFKVEQLWDRLWVVKCKLFTNSRWKDTDGLQPLYNKYF